MLSHLFFQLLIGPCGDVDGVVGGVVDSVLVDAAVCGGVDVSANDNVGSAVDAVVVDVVVDGHFVAVAGSSGGAVDVGCAVDVVVDGRFVAVAGSRGGAVYVGCAVNADVVSDVHTIVNSGVDVGGGADVLFKSLVAVV